MKFGSPVGSPISDGLPAGTLVSLQLARFLAAMLVIWVHAIESTQTLDLGPAYQATGGLRNLGCAGVDIFFVISGFIITRVATATGSGTSITGFLRNRIARVVPLYYLASLVSSAGMAGTIKLSAVLVTVTFWPALPGGMTVPLLDIGWTLCFEMLFYGVVALSLFHARIGQLALLAFAGLSVIRMVAPDVVILQFVANPIIIEFLLGVAIARYGAPLIKSPKLGSLALLCSGIALTMTVVGGFGDIVSVKPTIDASRSWLRVLVVGLPSALLVAGLLAHERHFRNQPGWLGVARIGDASYSIYLFHMPAIWAVERWLPASGLGSDVAIVLEMAASLAVGCGAHIVFERPLLQWLRRSRSGAMSGPGLVEAARPVRA